MSFQGEDFSTQLPVSGLKTFWIETCFEQKTLHFKSQTFAGKSQVLSKQPKVFQFKLPYLHLFTVFGFRVFGFAGFDLRFLFGAFQDACWPLSKQVRVFCGLTDLRATPPT